MDTNNTKDSFYTQREQAIIDRNLDRREQLISAMMADGVPTKTGEVRVIKEVIESIDNKITETAKLRLKHDENTNAANAAENAAEILKAIASRKATEIFIPQNNSIELEDKYMDTIEIVAGELEINPPTLTLDDIDN